MTEGQPSVTLPLAAVSVTCSWPEAASTSLAEIGLPLLADKCQGRVLRGGLETGNGVDRRVVDRRAGHVLRTGDRCGYAVAYAGSDGKVAVVVERRGKR